MHTLIADFKRLSIEMTGNNSSSSGNITGSRCQRDNESQDAAEGEGSSADRQSVGRKEWSEAAEGALYALQLSNASLLYPPLMIAIAALKITEPLGLFPITFDAYLSKRYGPVPQLTSCGLIERVLKKAKEPVDLQFLKTVCMERLKKESVWSKAKVKKSKVPVEVLIEHAESIQSAPTENF
jgi:hypothetical protein